MEKEKIDRINFLARKAKSDEGLTHDEAEEQHALRQEYLDEMRLTVMNVLDNTYIQDEKGNKTKLRKKK
ncbi:MAG TPA: DUF896 domain-containing protein [Candidatus Ventrousia excrementavium]|uniref:UPF0291 protein IAB67_05835 n=1 Tax=Candidatus Ventrousia excrementavium TaxID=2840961 RepID=A0A9D1IUX0_9CLOT|nr:DUF896 domain-containing protein [Candidatus Ventrousia excrementavium]